MVEFEALPNHRVLAPVGSAADPYDIALADGIPIRMSAPPEEDVSNEGGLSQQSL